MTAARRTLSTARRKARFASGVLPSCYTTFRDTTVFCYANSGEPAPVIGTLNTSIIVRASLGMQAVRRQK
jgi:hypothetical protein